MMRRYTWRYYEWGLLMAAGMLCLGVAGLSYIRPVMRGLTGQYYLNSDWSGVPWNHARDVEISHHAPTFQEAMNASPNGQFSVEWRGYIKIPAYDNRSFYTASDDGSWLWIDDQLIVDNGGMHGLQEQHGKVVLKAGWHRIKVRYAQMGGSAVLRLLWEQDDTHSKVPLDSAFLVPSTRINDMICYPFANRLYPFLDFIKVQILPIIIRFMLPSMVILALVGMFLAIMRSSISQSPYLKGMIFFIGIGLLYQLFVFNNRYPYVSLGSDAAAIASILAAKECPECFYEDELLGNIENIRAYQTIHIYMLPWLKKLFGDYGTAYHSMLGWHVAIQGFGFYCLGMWLFQDTIMAGILALMTLIRINVAFSTFWGVAPDALPRNSLAAVLPYLLLGALKYQRRPQHWWWLMACTGLLMYIHPVGAPVWGASIWLGFAVSLPSTWKISRKIGYMALLGLIFAMMILPFAYNYSGHHAHGNSVDYDLVYEIMQYRLGPMLNIGQGFITFLQNPTIQVLLYASLIGLFYLRVHKDHVTDSLAMILMWGVGILLISVLIPIAEHSITQYLRMIPFEIDLVRGIRFFVMLAMIVIFMGIHALAPTSFVEAKWLPLRFKIALAANIRYVRYALAIFLLCYLGHEHLAGTLPGGQIIPKSFLKMTPIEEDRIEALEYLKRLPRQAHNGIVSFSGLDPLSIRYYAYKPVVYAAKDGAVIQANPQQGVAWYEKVRILHSAKSGLIDVARQFQARYVVLWTDGLHLTESQEQAVIFRNTSFTIIDLQK